MAVEEKARRTETPPVAAAVESDVRLLGFAHAPDGLVVLDGDGTILAFSHAAETLFGWRADEILGETVDRLRPPEDAGGLETFAPTIGADGTRVWEVECVHRGGRRFSVEATAAPLHKPGAAETWVVAFRDVEMRKGVVDALISAEERLASITANLPGIVFQRIRRADGSISYPFFTDGVRDILGFAPEEMRVNAEGCLDVMHWADRERHQVAVQMSSIDMQPCSEEFRAITKAGEVRWLSGTSRPQLLANGDIVWDGLLIDVTERKRAELRLEMIMDHAADVIMTANEDGRIETVNAAAAQLFGYSADEMIGRPIASLMPEPQRAEHLALIARYVETGDETLLVGAHETVGLRVDRRTFPFEMGISEVRMEGRRLFIFIGRDITQRKRTEEALRETEMRLRSIAANLPGIVFQRVLTADGRLKYHYVSDGIRHLLGIDPAEVMADAEAFLRVMAPGDREKYLAALTHSAETLEPVEDELRVVGRDGRARWLRGSARPRRADNGDVLWDGVTLDVSDRKEAEERLRFLAYYDPVTGVGNRSLFVDHLDDALRLAGRSGRMVAVLCVGVDRFSIINTTLGHSVGDRVLAASARRLEDALNGTGTIARAGGDRFLLMAPGLRNETEVNQFVEAVVNCSQRPLQLEGDEFDLTASIGVSLYPRDAEDSESILKHAETALMRAKEHGPGTVQMFSEEMNASVVKTLSLQNRIRRAIDHAEFLPHFQPQVDLATGEVIGMEALARWISPELGMVSPAEFIPVAEDSGLIDALCDQILRAACRQNKAWQDAGLPAVPVAVNISGRQFQNSRRLLTMVETALLESGLDPRFLELELTESSAMRDAENAIAVVGMLRDRGIACAIDDFGTGYSSLSVLKRFPIHKLKIDRSFVRDVTDDLNDAAIVRAMVAMAHALRLKVVAEGVEVTGHLDFLRDVDCDQIQGYLFSRPLPAAEMEALFRQGKRLPGGDATIQPFDPVI